MDYCAHVKNCSAIQFKTCHMNLTDDNKFKITFADKCRLQVTKAISQTYEHKQIQIPCRY